MEMVLLILGKGTMGKRITKFTSAFSFLHIV